MAVILVVILPFKLAIGFALVAKKPLPDTGTDAAKAGIFGGNH
jgi:hypothetical protein